MESRFKSFLPFAVDASCIYEMLMMTMMTMMMMIMIMMMMVMMMMIIIMIERQLPLS